MRINLLIYYDSLQKKKSLDKKLSRKVDYSILLASLWLLPRHVLFIKINLWWGHCFNKRK